MSTITGQLQDTASVDLIYLDPPFNSNAEYAAPIGSTAAGAAFRDTWTLSDVDLLDHNRMKQGHPTRYALIYASGKAHSKGMFSYLLMMMPRLVECHRILKPTGSIYLHCDPTAGHYLKVLMDEVFGARNFRNEIAWQRAAGRAKGSQHAPRSFGADFDTLLFYGRSEKATFRGAYQPLRDDELHQRFPYTDDPRGRYNTAVPLFCQPSMPRRPNLCYTYKGVTNPHPSGWRVSEETLKQMDEDGRIIWRVGRRPLRKSFASEYKGKPIGSMWTDIPNETSSKRRTGYPTQKPRALLERIIRASSTEGDLVLDPFCGCATTMVAAELLDRKWCGIDLSGLAAKLVVQRIKQHNTVFRPTDVHHRTDVPVRTDLARKMASSPLARKRLKDVLHQQQDGRCNLCHHEFDIRNLDMDHIFPKALGGKDWEDNFQLLCGACNSVKGTGTQDEARKRLVEQRGIDFAPFA